MSPCPAVFFTVPSEPATRIGW